MNESVSPALKKRIRRDRRDWRLKIDFGRGLQIRRAGEKEALLLTLVCALDMDSTLWWVLTGRAHEANKLLAWTFQINPLIFVFVKCATCLPALLLAPRLAKDHPTLTRFLLRAILVAYLVSYVVGIYRTGYFHFHL